MATNSVMNMMKKELLVLHTVVRSLNWCIYLEINLEVSKNTYK